MKFLNKALAPSTAALGLIGTVEALQQSLNNKGGIAFSDAGAAHAALTMENYNPAVENSLEQVANGLKLTLEEIATQAKSSLSNASRAAAIVVGSLGSDIRGFSARKAFNHTSTDTARFIDAPGNVERIAAFEAYDEKENRSAQVYSIAYNMQAARQDNFGETLFPTVTVTPDQVGYAVSIHLVSVMDEQRHALSGATNNFNRRNIVHAVRDPSILFNNVTDVVPVVRAESEDNFVDPALLPPSTVQVGTEQVSTSALLFGKKFSLLGISSTPGLIAAGLLDSTDALDPMMRLKTLYLKIGAAGDEEVIAIPTADLPRAVFNYSVQGNARLLSLNFETSSLAINKYTRTVSGAASTVLAPLVAAGWVVRLGITVSGSSDAQTSTTSLMKGELSIVSLQDPSGVKHLPGSPAAAAIEALFADADIIGYSLDARRTNSNRRQRGKLLTSDIYNQIYNVPLLAPITTPRPLGQGDNTDASDLAALINATRVLTSNSAVDTLLKTASMLKTFVSNNDAIGDAPEILGVARWILDPYYEFKELKVDEIVNNVTSSEKQADIAFAMVNVIRDSAYRMWRESGWQPAADVLNGGQAQSPIVIVACDPVIARWLMIDGEIRLAGQDFTVKVVSTPNITMKGKMFITFGDPNVQEGVPSPLHFGNMAWKPELTLVLPLHRNGANSKELTVQPSFLHVVNLPVLTEVAVSGIELIAAGRTPIAFQDVTP